jgi:Arc/MetJ family transcription regulator
VGGALPPGFLKRRPQYPTASHFATQISLVIPLTHSGAPAGVQTPRRGLALLVIYGGSTALRPCCRRPCRAAFWRGDLQSARGSVRGLCLEVVAVVYRWCMARTNIDLDDEACETVMRRYHLLSKREAVNFALRTVAGEALDLSQARRLRGSGWDGALDDLRDSRVE